MEDTWGEWNRKGASLSDKTVRKEFGLTQEEIYAAIEAGRLQYRMQSIYGSPFLRLLRREVEAEVKHLRGGRRLQTLKREAELARIDREIRALRKQIGALETRRAGLLGGTSA